VRVGQEPVEQLRLGLELERENISRYNRAVALAREKGDNGTREILEGLLRGEEESADWLEAQLHIVGEIGKERWLAEQIRG
jgi:bacterioferritin